MEKDRETTNKKIDKILDLVAYITIIFFIILQLFIVVNLNEKIISLVIMSLYLIFWRFWYLKKLKIYLYL